MKAIIASCLWTAVWFFAPSPSLMAQGAPTATQATVAAYTAGGVMSVTNTLSYSGQLWSLLWRPHLPNAWVVTSVSGTGNPELEAGDIVWTGTLPASPIQMIYWVQVPAGARGSYSVRGEVEYQLSGMVNPANLYASPDPLSISNSPMVLTVTGLSAVNKVYDRTTVATLTGAATLSGVVPGDVVNLGGTATGSFADKTVGTNKLVTVSGLALTGADAGNYTLSAPNLSANITAATANVTGLTAGNKVYDGTTAATLTGTARLTGVVPGDVVNLSGTATGNFADKAVGTNKLVTVSGLSLTGADAGNYTLSLPSLSANITATTANVTGLTAVSKVYDGTTVATLTGTATLSGVVPGDVVNLSGTATGNFADKAVGTNKLVTVSGLSLTGADAGNYTPSLPSLSANITTTTANVTGLTAVSKVYDATTVATLTGTASLTGVVPGDAVNLSGTATGSFADKTVGTNKLVTVSGLALTGADAGNYTPSLPSLSANITTTTANVTGLTVVSKVYDATTVATLTGTASLAGVVPGDVVNLSGTATGSFADQTVGTNKTVTVSGLALTGADAGNYRLSVPTLTANITPAPLTVTGITAASKPYDGTTSATIDTVNAILNGVLPADSENVTLVTSGVTGAFADKNVGTGELVTISGLTLGGTAAGNYALTQPTTTADIIPIPPPIVASPTLVGQTFGVSVTTVTGLNYTLEYKNAFTDTAWTAVQTLPGTGGTITLTDRTATNAMRFYRLVTQ